MTAEAGQRLQPSHEPHVRQCFEDEGNAKQSEHAENQHNHVQNARPVVKRQRRGSQGCRQDTSAHCDGLIDIVISKWSNDLGENERAATQNGERS